MIDNFNPTMTLGVSADRARQAYTALNKRLLDCAYHGANSAIGDLGTLRQFLGCLADSLDRLAAQPRAVFNPDAQVDLASKQASQIIHEMPHRHGGKLPLAEAELKTLAVAVMADIMTGKLKITYCNNVGEVPIHLTALILRAQQT